MAGDENRFDVLVVGAGPAGMTAAVYARRAGKTVMILEKDTFGGQITHSPKIENYPGFQAVSGAELADKLVDQVLALNAGLDVDAVTRIETEGDWKKVVTERTEYYAKAVIVAAGAKHRTLGLPREEELTGNGISYCVLCDGAFYNDKHVAVIGGGNSAMQDAVLLSETCNRVTIVQNLAFLTGEARLIDKLNSTRNVDFIFNTVVTGFEGDPVLTGIHLRNTMENKVSRFDVDGIFVAIGQQPENEAFRSVCPLNEQGYIQAGEDCLTATPGVFAAGDCRVKTVRQITTAVGDGAAAALAACKYIESISW